MKILLYSPLLLITYLCWINPTNAQKARIVHVRNATQLQAALTTAVKGDEIIMEKGTYYGHFEIPATANGTAEAPIVLRGNTEVKLDAGTIQTNYVLHLSANYWHLKNFTLTNGLKGLVCDQANHNTIDNLVVHEIGEEAVHFRKFSCQNLLTNCRIYNTGLKTPDYGEGVYIGTAVSNWPKYTDGLPDKCDSNQVINNTIGPNVAAECIDLKEGSTSGLIKGNHFDATGITGANGADSWIDVKGNNYLIEGNIGFNPTGSILKDGYQVHCAVDGWGNNNQFKGNKSEVNATGYAINVTASSSKGRTSGNKVFDDNTAKGAASGVANVEILPSK